MNYEIFKPAIHGDAIMGERMKEHFARREYHSWMYLSTFKKNGKTYRILGDTMMIDPFTDQLVPAIRYQEITTSNDTPNTYVTTSEMFFERVPPCDLKITLF